MIKVLCLAFVLMGVVSSERNPRLFFASISSSTSTSTTTSTLSTGSFCYVTATASATSNCKRRKKKALIHSGADEDFVNVVSPSKTGSVEVAGSYGEANYRDARLFLLVTSTSTITATQTSTTTAYTATVTLSVSCTPTIFAACG